MTGETLEEMNAADAARALEAGEIVLIDVREPHEYGTERIPGALLMPLSTFDAAGLPAGDAKRIVLHCAAGKRSAMAADLARQAGVDVSAHMSGGLMAWKQAGLETLTIQPSTGQMIRSKG